MLQDVKKIYEMMDRKDKTFLPIAFIMVLLFSVFELVSIGILIPFINFIKEPEQITTAKYLGPIFNSLNVDKPEDFVIWCCLFLVILYFLKFIYSIAFYYVFLRYSRLIYKKIVKRLFENFTLQPYMNFINSNTADYSQSLLQESNNAVSNIPQYLTLMAELLTLFLLLSLMLFTDFELTLIVLALLLLTCAMIAATISRKVYRLGIEKVALLGNIFRILNESFGNVKILKLNCTEKYGVDKFMSVINPYVTNGIYHGTLQVMPKSIIEFVGFFAIILVISKGILMNNFNEFIPIVTVFAMSFFRMVPSVNRIVTAFNAIKFNHKSVDMVYSFFNLKRENPGRQPCTFESTIELRNVSFFYDKTQPVISNINLTITKGSKVGFIGESGCGKSTLLDILVGINPPSKGVVVVDGKKMSEENVRSFREKIGYIPQHVYLFDGTIGENVSMGFDSDEKKIIEVLKKAKIYEVLQEKQGVHTLVGEGGIKLSGGQKQRIAIARAIYKNPEILVLDEATSALDHETERMIIDEMYDIAENKTILMVAHRLTTLDRCDIIYKVKNGRVWNVAREVLTTG